MAAPPPRAQRRQATSNAHAHRGTTVCGIARAHGVRLEPGRIDAGVFTYRSRLLGQNEAWSGAATHPEITFTDLEGGPFTLEVIATDAAGNSSSPLRYAFSVAPPWQRTSWAYDGYGLLGAAAVVDFVRWP